MRTLLLSGASTYAGAEVHTLGLASRLAARGHDIRIGCLTKKTGQVYRDAGCDIPLVSLSEGAFPHGRKYREWCARFSELNADYCIYAKPTLHHGSFALDWAARRVHRRFVVFEHLEPPIFSTNGSHRYFGLSWWRMREMLRGRSRSWAPHVTVANSFYVRRRLISEYGFKPSKLITIHCGVDPSAFTTSDDGGQSLRHAWGIDPDTFLFGCASRIEHRKGLDLAVDAFKRLRDSAPDRKLALVMVGEGSQRNEITSLVEKLGLSEHVLLPGRMHPVIDAYRAFDAFLLPSRIEALGISLLEAMACELPSVAARVGGPAEVLAAPDCGWLVEGDDAPALAAAMHEVIKLTPNERREVGSRARDRVVHAFDAGQAYDRIATLLEIGSGDIRDGNLDATSTIVPGRE